MRTRLIAGLLLLPPLLAAGVQNAPAPDKALQSRLRHARESLEREDDRSASRHAQAALLFEPEHEAALRIALESCGPDKDARILWAHRAWAAQADAEGVNRSKLGTSIAKQHPGVPLLAAARAAAVKELAKLAKAESKRSKRSPPSGLIALWAAELGTDLSRDSSALLKAHAGAFDVRFEVNKRSRSAVFDALKRVRSGAHARGDYKLAVRAALILRGFAAQASYHDLQGEAPTGVPALRRDALESLQASRRALEAKGPRVWTVDELEELDESQAREFSAQHGEASNPGIAVSPNGFYRIETSCGFETLLGVAKSIELHHERLALWFGHDPFEGQPGLIRVLPEAAGLEGEGAPFWWVGGFQAGDVTTARFSCSNLESFGHLLTHELTHRFDGAIYPGSPSWLAEGKAVWTGGSYENSFDDSFVADHIRFGQVERAWIMGYGGPKKLQELIEGEIEEYRDNYVAGYALYVYLKLWQDDQGVPVYAASLVPYMQGLSGHRKKPLEWFTRHFANGEAGKPVDFEAFASAFKTFMAGFYWDDRADWTERYQSQIGGGGGSWVYDAPTWSWSRSRAEPFWGQDHAQAAGDLLVEMDKQKDAALAYLWAWTVDERSPRLGLKLQSALDQTDQGEAAWTVRRSFEQDLPLGGEPGVENESALLRLPLTSALARALGQEAKALNEAGFTRAAAALRADGTGLARHLGQAPARPAGPPEFEDRRHPWDRPAQLLGLSGWEEAGLTGYEKRRAKDCWYVEEDGDLHVGRFRPRDGTGTLDRRAHNRHAYARTTAVQSAGRYAIRCKVQFTTSYVSGTLVLGDSRRDRNIRLRFSAGDFYYSIGKTEQAEELEAVGWSVQGLRERDGALSGSGLAGRVTFDSPKTNFELLAIVDGATAHFWIEGRYLGAYHDALGTPIVGHIGFATGQGAVRIIEPTVQRLDRSRETHRPLPPGIDGVPVAAGLDLGAPPQGSFRWLQNLPVRGIRPQPNGSLLVWIPMKEWSDEFSEFMRDELKRKALKWTEQTMGMIVRADANTPILLAVPDKLGSEALQGWLPELRALDPTIPVDIVTYAWEEDSLEEVDLTGASRSWLCFVDSAGVLRTIDRFYSFKRVLPDDILHWVTVFRDESRR